MVKPLSTKSLLLSKSRESDLKGLAFFQDQSGI